MRKLKIILSVLFGWLLISCGTKHQDQQDVVAQVNAAIMTNSQLEEAIAITATDEIKMALKRKLMEKWIEDEIFYQAALEEGMTLSSYEETLVKNYHKKLLIEKYLAKYLNKNYRVLDQEIEDYYSAHRQEFVWDEEYVNIVHLVLDSDERVIRNEIRTSKDLNEVITKNFFDQKSTSERPIGNLGYVRLTDLPSRLASRIKNIKTGIISGPIKTDIGYHYVQLLDLQREGDMKDLDIVRDEIIHRLQIQKRQAEIENLMRKLRKNFSIQTDLSKLTQP